MSTNDPNQEPENTSGPTTPPVPRHRAQRPSSSAQLPRSPRTTPVQVRRRRTRQNSTPVDAITTNNTNNDTNQLTSPDRRRKRSRITAPLARSTITENRIPPITATPGQPTARKLYLWAPTHDETFQTRVPMLTHVPPRCRSEVSFALSLLLWDCAMTSDETHSLNAHLNLFIFARCVLHSLPPSHVRRVSPQGPRSIHDTIRARVARWRSGEAQQMWAEILRKADATNTMQAQRIDTESQERRNISRAIRFTRDGAFGKASRALASKGTSKITTSVQQQILCKHPQVAPESEATHAAYPNNPPPNIEPFTPLEIHTALRRFSRSASGGGSGLSPTHLRELAASPTSHEEGGMLQALSALCSKWARGNAPAALSPWITSAPLTALRKDLTSEDIRPIAVGETLRRMVGSLLIERHTPAIRQYFQPHQLGVATRGGTEIIGHTARELARIHVDNQNIGLLQLDFKNAFNAVSRAAIIKEVRKKFPAMAPWTRYCYDGTKAHLWARDFELRSVTGVQQGDPLGPFLFSLALQPIIIRVLFRIRTYMNNTADDLTTPSALLFYLDDGIIIGPHGLLAELAHYLMSNEVKAFGLHLKPSGTRVWWPTPPSHVNAARYPPGIQVLNAPGIKIVGIPIGDPDYVAQEVTSHANGIGQLLRKLRTFDDAHAAFSLGRACLGTCRMNFLLRAIPPAHTCLGAKRFHEHLFDFASYLAGGMLSPAMFREITLPIKITNPALPHAGVGLTSAADTAAATFLASLSSTAAIMPLIATNSNYDEVLRDSTTRLLAHNFPPARAAYDEYLLVVPPGKAPSFESLFGSDNSDASDDTTITCPSPHVLSTLVHEKTINDLHASSSSADQRTDALRTSFTLPKAKEWLKCIPSPALRTHIPHAHFMTAFSFHCQNRRNSGPRSPRRRCYDSLDEYGDHMMSCIKADPNGRSLITRRHDKLVRLVAKSLLTARRSPVVEPREPLSGGRRNSRPDIVAIGAMGGEDHLDISISHVLAPSKIAKGPLKQLQSVATSKRTQHEQRIAATPGARLVPIVKRYHHSHLRTAPRRHPCLGTLDPTERATNPQYSPNLII